MIEISINVLIHPVTRVEWRAENLPEGLSINSSTGEITGIPTKIGEYECTIICENNWGATSTKKKFIIKEPLYPKLFGEKNYESFAHDDVLINFEKINCNINNDITSVIYSAQNLPEGLNIDENTGTISGTLTLAKIYNTIITVTNNFGSGTFNFTYNVKDISYLYPKFIDKNYSHISYLNENESFKIDCENSEIKDRIRSVTWSAQNLPEGLNIDENTGTISGTPKFNIYAIDVPDNYSKVILKSYNVSITCTNNLSSDTINYNHDLYLYKPPYFYSARTKYNYYANENDTSPISSTSRQYYLRLGAHDSVRNNVVKGTFTVPILYNGGTFKIINNKFTCNYLDKKWYSCIATITDIKENANYIMCDILCKFDKFEEITNIGANDNNTTTFNWPLIIRYEINNEYTDYELNIICTSGYDENMTSIDISGIESKQDNLLKLNNGKAEINNIEYIFNNGTSNEINENNIDYILNGMDSSN